jgi:hypothetical protein
LCPSVFGGWIEWSRLGRFVLPVEPGPVRTHRGRRWLRFWMRETFTHGASTSASFRATARGRRARILAAQPTDRGVTDMSMETEVSE